MIIVSVISVLLALFTWNTVNDARVFDRVRNIIIEETEQFAYIELIDLTIIKDGSTRNITATIRTSEQFSESEAGAIQDRLTEAISGDVFLELITVPMQLINPNSTNE